MSTIATVADGRTATVTVTAAASPRVGGMAAIAIISIVAASAVGVTAVVVALTGDEASPSQ